MLFQIATSEPEYILATVLWSIATGLLFFSFGWFLRESIKAELKSRKRVYLGYGLFALMFGFTRFFFLISDLFIGESHDFVITLGYFTGILGLIFIIYVLETYLLKTKKILTVITVICFIIVVVAILGVTSRSTALLMIYILSPAALLTAAIVYIYLIINSTGVSRKKAIGALLGMILMFLGHFMDSLLFTSLWPNFPLAISPIVMIVGILLYSSSQLLIN